MVGATSYTAQSQTTAHGAVRAITDGSYTYTLTNPVTEAPGQQRHRTFDGVESFGYTARYALGNTVNGTVTINVNDDTPKATPPATPVNQRFRTPTC